MIDTSKLTQLSSGTTSYRYERPEASMLESFPNPQTSIAWAVALDCSEFTCICPVTGQPDFGRIYIHYVPGDSCVESKSLKLYLGAYRQHGSFHEECVNRIADDLVTTIAPRYLRVFGDFHARGGIAIRPLAVRVADGVAEPEEVRCAGLVAQYGPLGALGGGAG